MVKDNTEFAMFNENITSYLYRHIRLDKNEPFYIGVSSKINKKGNGFEEIYRRAFIKNKRNNIWKSIVAKTDYEVEILMESDDYEFIKQKEIEFISLYGRIDLSTGTLANMTDGGEGTTGKTHSKEQRKINSNKNKGKNNFHKNLFL